MKKAVEIKPKDISTGLFMDLAFLLIAALVLLVQEPGKEKADFNFIEIRRSTVDKVEEKDLPGESLFLELLPSGEVMEVLYNNQRNTLSPLQIAHRIDQMDQQGDRVIALFIDQDAPYAKIANTLDEVAKMQLTGKISKVYEITGKD